MGLLSGLGLARENGSCSDCAYGYRMGGRCRYFSKQEYSRVSGTTTQYGDCHELRASGGACGLSGKYWTQADTRIYEDGALASHWEQNNDTSFPGDSGSNM